MKKIILLAVLLIGYYLPIYSQTGKGLQIDTIKHELILKNDIKVPSLFESKDLSWMLTDSLYMKGNSFPKLRSNKLNGKNDSFSFLNKTTIIDKMPCFVPEGYSPMPVYVPDSSVNYTLLIKRK